MVLLISLKDVIINLKGNKTEESITTNTGKALTIKYSCSKNSDLTSFIQDLLELKEDGITTISLLFNMEFGTPHLSVLEVQAEWIETLKAGNNFLSVTSTGSPHNV